MSKIDLTQLTFEDIEKINQIEAVEVIEAMLLLGEARSGDGKQDEKANSTFIAILNLVRDFIKAPPKKRTEAMKREAAEGLGQILGGFKNSYIEAIEHLPLLPLKNAVTFYVFFEVLYNFGIKNKLTRSEVRNEEDKGAEGEGIK